MSMSFNHLRSIGHKTTGKIAKKIHAVSFTTVDAFTFIICAWVDEAVKLGVSPNLKSTVLSLWAKYLRQMQMAFIDDRHCRRQNQPGPGLAPSFRDIQVGMYKRRRLITASEWGHKRAARSRQTTRQHLVDHADYSLLDKDGDSREARRVRSKMRRNFHKQLANERVAEDHGTEMRGGASSEDSAASFLSDASFLSSGGCGAGGPVPSPLNSSSSAASPSEEVEEERSDVVGTQTRAIERVTLHRPRFRNLSNEQICRLTLRNAFGLFSLGVLLQGESEMTLTTSDLAFMAQSGAISYTNASIHIPELLVIRGTEDTNKFIGRNPPTRKDLKEIIYKMGSFLQLVKVHIGNQESFRNVLQRFLDELSLPHRLASEIMQTFASTKYFEFTAELLPTRSLANRLRPERMPATDEKALGVILFALKYIYGLDDINNADAGGELNLLGTSSVAAEDKIFNMSDWIICSRYRAFWACKRTHLLRHRLGKLFPGVELSEPAAIHEAEQNALMTRTSRASVATNTGAMVYVTNFQENLASELKREIFSNNDDVDRLDDVSCDFSGSLTPLKDYTNHRLDCLKERKRQNDRFRDEFDVLEKLSALRQCTIKIKPTRIVKGGEHAHMLQMNSNRSEFRRRMGTALSYDMYSKERKKPTRGCKDITTRVWRLEVATKWQKTGYNSSDFLQEELLSALPEDFGWVLRYVSTYFDCSVVDVYRNMQEAENLALKMDPSYFGEISDP